MTIKLHLARDSVAAGDDMLAPNGRTFRVENTITSARDLQDAVIRLAPDYLPGVEGGGVSWAAWSGLPLAVFSNRGTNPRGFFLMDSHADRFDRTADGIRVWFTYFGDREPDAVFDILSRTLMAQTGGGWPQTGSQPESLS